MCIRDRCVDHILAINRTNIEIQRGNFSSWWENRRRQDAFELARQEKLQKDIGLSLIHILVRTVVLPNAVDGIVTGCILAVGRIVGESAALLLSLIHI